MQSYSTKGIASHVVCNMNSTINQENPFAIKGSFINANMKKDNEIKGCLPVQNWRSRDSMLL